ncbi:MAG: hypothetical protein ACLFP1_05340 [Candidatus Goldiibacteriota bacterium]
MADEINENAEENKDPKDTTPNPLEEAEKTSEKQDEPQEENASSDKENEDQKKTGGSEAKETGDMGLVDSRGWTRALQIALLVGGAFLVFTGVFSENFLWVPAVFGGVMLTLAALLELHILKKFIKEPEKIDWILKWILFAVPAALLLLYTAEIWMPLTQKNNFIILSAAFGMAALVFMVQFIMYIKNNTGKFIADVAMFTAVAAALISIYLFVFFQLVFSIIFAVLAGIGLIVSFQKDTVKQDSERDFIRIWLLILAVLFILPVIIYASGIFYEKRIEVLQFAKISPDYREKPVNLSWSDDSWALAYSVYDKEKEGNRINIIHGLTRGLLEIPAEGAQTLLPKTVDRPYWNKRGDMLVFTAADSAEDSREIWGISVNLALMDLPERLWEEYMYYEAKPMDIDVVINERGEIVSPEKLLDEEAAERRKIKRRLAEEYPHSSYLFTGKINTKEDQEVKLAYEQELKKKFEDRPAGKPKTLVTSFEKIIDENVRPIKHRTAWSPDGDDFVFAMKYRKNLNIWKANVESQDAENLVKGNKKENPLWSPSGELVLYTSRVDSYTFLEVSNYDGSNPRELNINSKRDRDLFPLWNAAETKVIYIPQGEKRFVIMNANSTNQRTLGRKTLVSAPYWLTENEKRVKLKYTDSGNVWRIWTIRPNGSGNKEIFRRVCEGFSQPKWSSTDGGAIAVGVNYPETGELWRLDKDGKNQRKIFTTRNSVKTLEWAPESDRIAFIVSRKGFIKEEARKKHSSELKSSDFEDPHGTEELWVVNRDGTNPLKIYHTKGLIGNISWDSQGKRIAFQEQYRKWYFIPDLKNIKIVHAIDGDLWKLLPYDFYGENPVWTDDGDNLAYVGWTGPYFPSLKTSVWNARIQ